MAPKSNRDKIAAALKQLRKLAEQLPQPYQSEAIEVVTTLDALVTVALMLSGNPTEGDPPTGGVYLAKITGPDKVERVFVAEWVPKTREWRMPSDRDGGVIWWGPKFSTPQPTWRALPSMETIEQGTLF